MGKGMEFAASWSRFRFVVLMLMFSNNYIADVSGWSTFRLINSTNVPEQSIIIETFSGIKSTPTCAMKCLHLDIESFYYVPVSSTCYCNSATDDSIVEAATGSMVYGYLVNPHTQQGNTADCQQLYDEGVRSDGEHTTSSGDKVRCSFASLGWVVFQRRLDGSENFQRNWTEYVTGFGNTTGEFWLGLEALHQITKAGCQLHVYLEAEPDHSKQDKGFARYTNFSIGDASTNYTLYLDGFSGSVGNSLNIHNGMQFSAYDVDNDHDPDVNCALEKGRGGWWFAGSAKACSNSNLNGLYLAGYRDSYKGIKWKHPWGGRYSLFRTEMAIKC